MSKVHATPHTHEELMNAVPNTHPQSFDGIGGSNPIETYANEGFDQAVHEASVQPNTHNVYDTQRDISPNGNVSATYTLQPKYHEGTVAPVTVQGQIEGGNVYSDTQRDRDSDISLGREPMPLSPTTKHINRYGKTGKASDLLGS